MKIFYFTGTGNSLWVAKEIKNQFPEAKIESIIPGKSYSTSDSKVGFIFPCYCLTVPKHIRNFIKEVSFTNSNVYTFAITTHNGVPGRTLNVFDKLLKSKKLKLNYGAEILMPGNSVIIKDYTNSKEEVNNRLTNAPNSLKKIIASIGSKEETSKYYSIPLWKILKTSFEEFILNNFYMPKPFWADNKCNSCKTCVKVCPSKSISINANKPEWGKGCLACLACYHWCPKQAIQLKKYTFDRPRLHNPNIKLNEIL